MIEEGWEMRRDGVGWLIDDGILGVGGCWC